MPSVYSFSRPRDWPSSTVTTPSLPTLSMTSAIMSPTSGSAAEIVAMAAISSRESIGRDCFLISATTASTAFSMPMRISIGFAPAVTLRMPSLIIAWPRTTAVVVPSGRDNMIAWVAARCEGADYGHLFDHAFSKDKLIYGPYQIQARINQNPEISPQLSLWNQMGSKVLLGNLLVIPIT